MPQIKLRSWFSRKKIKGIMIWTCGSSWTGAHRRLATGLHTHYNFQSMLICS